MAASGRVVGMILVAVGLIVGAAILVWLLFGVREGNLAGSGAAFGIVLLFGFIVLPLVGAGIYMLFKGRAEAKDIARVEEQRKLIGIIATQGQIAIADLVLEMHSTRDQIKADLYDLVSRGLFSGYVDWNKGELFSVEASQLEGRQTCPNCGGKLELVGKGLIKCPYCGAEIFLSGTK